MPEAARIVWIFLRHGSAAGRTTITILREAILEVTDFITVPTKHRAKCHWRGEYEQKAQYKTEISKTLPRT